MESFGLEVAEEKTNLIRFSRQDWQKNGSFEFLGFEFRWGRGRWGKPVIKRPHGTEEIPGRPGELPGMVS